MVLKELCNCNGISGHEKKVRDFIRKEISSYADDIQVDSLGNLLVKNGVVTVQKESCFSSYG